MNDYDYPPIENLEPMELTEEARLFARLADERGDKGVGSLFRALAQRIAELEPVSLSASSMPASPPQDVLFSERKMFSPRDLDRITKPLQAEIERLKAAISWALGESGTFSEEPEPIAGKWRRRFWWRQGLRERAFGDQTAAGSLASSPQEQPK